MRSVPDLKSYVSPDRNAQVAYRGPTKTVFIHSFNTTGIIHASAVQNLPCAWQIALKLFQGVFATQLVCVLNDVGPHLWQ